MSAGAPINIPAILDLTKPYADLAAFRAAAAQPVTIGAGAGGTSTSTFGSPGSQPFAANSVIGAYQANGQQSAGISQLTAAIQSLAAAVVRGGGGGSNTFGTWNPGNQSFVPLSFDPTRGGFINPQNGIGIADVGWPGGGSGTGGRGGRGGGVSGGGGGYRGFARYIGPAFLAHEALRLGQDVRQTNIESILASNDPLEQIAAQQSLIQRVGNFPILGQVAGLIADPLGNQEAITQATVRNARLSSEYAQRNLKVSNQVESSTRQASIAGIFSGSERTGAEIQDELRLRISSVQQQRRETGEFNDQLAKSERAIAIASNQPSLLDRIFWPVTGSGYQDITEDRENALSGIAHNARARNTVADQQAAAGRQAAVDLAAVRTRENQFKLSQEAESFSNQADVLRLQSGRYNDRGIQRNLERNQANRTALSLFHEKGGTVAAEYLAKEEARYGEEDATYQRQFNSEVFQLGNSGRRGILAARGDTFGVRLAQLYGSFRDRFDANRDPNLVAPILGNYLQGVEATAIASGRESDQLNASTASINASISRQPREALRIDNDRRRQQALFGTAGLPNLGNFGFGLDFNIRDRAQRSINANFDAQLIHGNQRIDDSTISERVGIRSQTAELGIQNDRSVDPAVRRQRADVFSVTNRTQQRALQAFLGGRPGLVPDIYQLGQAQLQQMSNARLDSITTEVIDPLRQRTSGRGTEDLSAILKAIQDGNGALKNLPSTLQQLLTVLGTLAAGQ